MTNEPSYDQQLALDAYWRDIGGQARLPGTDRPADRFVRASHYLRGLLATPDPIAAAAGMFSIIRNVSVPFGVTTSESPNVAPTLWRTVADQKDMVYYFDSTTSPNVFRVDVGMLNLTKGQPTGKLAVDGKILAGETSSQFQPATPFTFLPASTP